MLDIGVTGTQAGGTPQQLLVLRELLRPAEILTLHHGDCIGVDAQAHEIMRSMPRRTGFGRIIIHPPDDPGRRAFCQGDAVWEERPYLERNRDIAKAASLLIVVPSQMTEVLRSGTWATARYAYKAGKLVLVIRPDGVLEPYRPKEE